MQAATVATFDHKSPDQQESNVKKISCFLSHKVQLFFFQYGEQVDSDLLIRTQMSILL